jgi:hypothetical protein
MSCTGLSAVPALIEGVVDVDIALQMLKQFKGE